MSPCVTFCASWTAVRRYAGPVVGEATTSEADVANTCRHAKRLLGRSFEDVAELADVLPYRVEADADGNAVVSLPAVGQMLPELVCAEIVKVRTQGAHS